MTYERVTKLQGVAIYYIYSASKNVELPLLLLWFAGG